MDVSLSTLQAAHARCSYHEAEILRSAICGCFHCRATFGPSEIEDWLDDEPRSALCPRCGIDSVIGDASGYPVQEANFLRAMYHHYLERSFVWDERRQRFRPTNLYDAIRQRMAKWFDR